jgi:hypothetical protein
MPFILRPYRCLPVQFAVTANAGPFQGQGTVRLGHYVMRLTQQPLF